MLNDGHDPNPKTGLSALKLDGQTASRTSADTPQWCHLLGVKILREASGRGALRPLVATGLEGNRVEPHLRPDGIPVTCSHESSTGGGIDVEMVEVLMSPMIPRPSRRAWYILSISSRC